jgi:hypothetical protein
MKVLSSFGDGELDIASEAHVRHRGAPAGLLAGVLTRISAPETATCLIAGASSGAAKIGFRQIRA